MSLADVIVPVRVCRRGRTHAVTLGAESPRQTLCNLDSDGALVADLPVDCKRCLRRMP